MDRGRTTKAWEKGRMGLQCSKPLLTAYLLLCCLRSGGFELIRICNRLIPLAMYRMSAHDSKPHVANCSDGGGSLRARACQRKCTCIC